MPNTKFHVAALRTNPNDGSPSSIVVAYLYAHAKPWRPREGYDDLIRQAEADYGQDLAVGTMGCGITVTPAKPLPEHEAIASVSFVYSLLKTGWKFGPGSFFVHPIPLLLLAEVAHEAALFLAAAREGEMPLERLDAALEPVLRDEEKPEGMTLADIKAAVTAGRSVHWMNRGYEVIKDSRDQWFIRFERNGHCIGLTHADGTTMNGEPEDFFLGD